MTSEKTVEHVTVSLDEVPEGLDESMEESNVGARGSVVYCSDAKIDLKNKKWTYYRDAKLPMDDPNTACGTDHMNWDYDSDDVLRALGYCENGREKFKISK